MPLSTYIIFISYSRGQKSKGNFTTQYNVENQTKLQVVVFNTRGRGGEGVGVGEVVFACGAGVGQATKSAIFYMIAASV